VLQDGSAGEVWVHASVSNDTIEINRSSEKRPSSKITTPRKISKEEFLELYPFYYKWREGTVSREFIRDSMSQNSSYIFALIHEFDDNVCY